MKSVVRWLKKYWPIIPILIILIFSILSVLEVRAQDDLVNELNMRLNQLEVPVKSINVDSRVPFQITITLQSTTAGDHRTEEDSMNEYMAYREAILARKFGLNLDSFIVGLINIDGDVIDWKQRFLTFQLINPYFSVPKNLDNQATEALLREQLDFQDLTVGELTVTTGAGSAQDVQSVLIWLSATDLQTANRAIPNIIGMLINQLNKINQESNYSLIAVCRLWVTDDNGNILLRYMYDLELGMQKWGIAPGVTKDWFPHPYATPTPTPIRPTATPDSYPPPLGPTAPAYPFP
jgi:hypothetical protein